MSETEIIQTLKLRISELENQLKSFDKEQRAADFNLAIFNLKQEIRAVSKDKKNPFFNSNYADINAYLGAVEPLLGKYGLFLLQPIKTNGVMNAVETIICHKNGENISSSMKLPDLDDPQKLGGSVTYFRRFTLGSLLAMKSEDDDGNVASGKTKTTTKKSSVNTDF